MEIIVLKRENKLLEKGIEYFWKQWGNASNFNFYKDCIENSFSDDISLPKFYLLLDKETIVGSYALLTNDIISRQDLMPWFACLYIGEKYRNKGFAEKLLEHGLSQSQKKGFHTLYLSTDLDGFYEKKGWHYHSKGYGVHGDEIKIYSKETH